MHRIRLASALALPLATTVALIANTTSTANAASSTGLQQQHTFERFDGKTQPARPTKGTSKTLVYGGGVDGIGVTSGQPKVYLVFWGTQWGTAGTDSAGNTTFTNDSYGGAPALQGLFKGLGSNKERWSTVMTQYCDGAVAKGATTCPSGAAHIPYPSAGVLAGVWYDNAAAEPVGASQSALAAEAVRAAGHFGNTTPASNRYAQYVVLSAQGTNPDRYTHKSFCAWHSYTTSTVGDVAYTNMPYVMEIGSPCGANFVNSGTAGLRDGYTIVEGHEYSETITDQNPAGGWVASSGQENADECAWVSPSSQGGAGNVSLSTGSFPLQGTWSNSTNECELQMP